MKMSGLASLKTFLRSTSDNHSQASTATSACSPMSGLTRSFPSMDDFSCGARQEGEEPVPLHLPLDWVANHHSDGALICSSCMRDAAVHVKLCFHRLEVIKSARRPPRTSSVCTEGMADKADLDSGMSAAEERNFSPTADQIPSQPAFENMHRGSLDSCGYTPRSPSSSPMGQSSLLGRLSMDSSARQRPRGRPSLATASFGPTTSARSPL